jgi:hypothetical protein
MMHAHDAQWVFSIAAFKPLPSDTSSKLSELGALRYKDALRNTLPGLAAEAFAKWHCASHGLPAGARSSQNRSCLLPAVIKDFGKYIGADTKQVQGLIKTAKKNGERLGFLA